VHALWSIFLSILTILVTSHTVLFASIMCYGVVCFFIDSNYSRNGNMVKDKHAKALAFMANMKFTDSCIGYDAGEKKCKCLEQFLGEEVSSIDAKNFFQHFL